ncbi:MAG: SAM-dependent chlorinase/fluorinase [Chloroflexi bacterium]|nr:SAM-dependent chlorinase/fluorinase [Chloroflexota bacterium]
MTCITLLTDFGEQDVFVGILRGVILSIAPEAQIVDLTHLIPPQDVRQGARALARAAPHFPPGTIHLAVVDPGVGTARRPMAARIGPQWFVGPDNGLATLLVRRAQRVGLACEAVLLDRREYWLREVSHVFHGRDIFAPVAAHLACGVALTQLGSPLPDPILLRFAEPQETASGLRGEVTSIDRFGNVLTNIEPAHLAGGRLERVRLGQAEIAGMVHTFGDGPAGALVALWSSDEHLCLAEVNGNGALRLGARPGDAVDVFIARRASGEAL